MTRVDGVLRDVFTLFAALAVIGVLDVLRLAVTR